MSHGPNHDEQANVPPRSTKRSRRTWLEIVLMTFIILTALGGAAAYLLHWGEHQWGRIASSSNLRQIGLALSMYAKANNGQLPSDWGDLLTSKDIEITPDVFRSPFSPFDDSKRNLSIKDHARLVGTPGTFATTYVFTASGLQFDALGADSVMAIEPAEVNDSDGAQILFSDGHADWLELKRHTKNREAYDRLIKDFAEGVQPLRFAIAPEWPDYRRK